MTYAEYLADYRRDGAAKCGERALMAAFCESPLQQLVGAVSPKLVFDGAIKKGLTTHELARLCRDDPQAVSDLQWL
jgi:hypothetical protein